MTTARDFARAVNPSAYLADDVKRWSIDEIKSAMIADGSHWWDHTTMRYFQSRISAEVFQGIGGIYFVSSERNRCSMYNDVRAYTVRCFDPDTLNLSNASDFGGYATRSGARIHAKRLSITQLATEQTQ